MANQPESTSPPSPLNYSSYLQIDKLLDCQLSLSETAGKPAHEEHLFIITHQAFELWFKQVLHDLDSVRTVIPKLENPLEDKSMHLITTRLNRCALILKMLPEQFHILETMTPLDFLDFRGYLGSGSGFQSLQFRLLENRLGVRDKLRQSYNGLNYKRCFTDKRSKSAVDESLQADSLFTVIERWLERIVENEGANFINKYRSAVEKWSTGCGEKEAENNICPMKCKEQTNSGDNGPMTSFKSIFDEEAHQTLVKSNQRRFSLPAIRGALLVTLYRDMTKFQQAHRLLTLLIDIDELMMRWRAHHLSMVHRMIGNKMGTGGSSGYSYLQKTFSDDYKVFLDLYNLSGFLIPQEFIPPLNDDTYNK